jgi:erythromycin esterase
MAPAAASSTAITTAMRGNTRQLNLTRLSDSYAVEQILAPTGGAGRFAVVCVTRMARAVALVCLTLGVAVGALAVQSADTRWISWLRENHHALRPPAAASSAQDDYADLQFLKQVIGDRRIVQIGESHHSVAEYGALKTRLIKFLHQEMGFGVLAFESSIYECFAADLRQMTPEDSLFATLFSVWAFEDVLPLFAYLKETQSTARPLAFAGFDPQISSSSGVATRPDFFQRVIGVLDPGYAREVAQFDAQFIDRIQRDGPPYANQEGDRLVAFYTRLSNYLEVNRDALAELFPGDASPLMAHRVAWSSIKLVELMRSFANDPNDVTLQGHMAIRDSAMADNLTFLANTLHPGKKIIVWAANIHVRHANEQTTWVFPTMGGWLKQRFGGELYTIGLYPNRGTVPGGRTVFTIDPAEPGTLERLLSDAGAPQLFVDLLSQPANDGTRWMYEPMLSRDASISGPQAMLPVLIVPREQYDGLIFIDRVSAPRFLSR